ncbi:Eco47II family restriction endonuclease [Candidatus Marsarchaeota archaeon]|jgi:hypothetical protein|nr:Eco47II family restriction endonuclease [Candidatus Marsarchaeota archaeon]
MMTNKYVDFVPDAHFLACVGSVCKAYHEVKENLSVEDLKGNGLDPFKTVFDIANRKLTLNTWIKNEEVRQADDPLCDLKVAVSLGLNHLTLSSSFAATPNKPAPAPIIPSSGSTKNKRPPSIAAPIGAKPTSAMTSYL